MEQDWARSPLTSIWGVTPSTQAGAEAVWLVRRRWKTRAFGYGIGVGRRNYVIIVVFDPYHSGSHAPIVGAAGGDIAHLHIRPGLLVAYVRTKAAACGHGPT